MHDYSLLNVFLVYLFFSNKKLPVPHITNNKAVWKAMAVLYPSNEKYNAGTSRMYPRIAARPNNKTRQPRYFTILVGLFWTAVRIAAMPIRMKLAIVAIEGLPGAVVFTAPISSS